MKQCIYIPLLLLAFSKDILGFEYIIRSECKSRDIKLTRVTNEGKKIHIGTLPVMNFRGEYSRYEIEFCKNDIRFNLNNDNIILDSIKVCEIRKDTLWMWQKIQMDAFEEKHQKDGISLFDLFVESLRRRKKTEVVCDTLTITNNMLRDGILLQEMAYAECKRLNRAILFDKTMRMMLLSLLQKEEWIEIQYYSRSLNKGKEPQSVEYYCKDFTKQYEAYIQKSKEAPQFRKIRMTPHSNRVIERTTLTKIGIKKNPRDTDNYKHGVNLNDLSESDERRSIIKRKKIKRITRPGGKKSAGMRGGRSRANIMRTVRNNMASLKYAYNRRLKARPGIKGKVLVRWSIDEFGTVRHCKIVTSTMQDPTFEKEIVRKIKAWAFGRIPIPGDVTEVTYPFVFSE